MSAGPRGPTAGPDIAFQRLWTKYAALPQYDKAEWTAAFNEIWESPGAPPAARRVPTDAMIDAALQACPVEEIETGGPEGTVTCSVVNRTEMAEVLRAALTAGNT